MVKEMLPDFSKDGTIGSRDLDKICIDFHRTRKDTKLTAGLNDLVNEFALIDDEEDDAVLLNLFTWLFQKEVLTISMQRCLPEVEEFSVNVNLDTQEMSESQLQVLRYTCGFIVMKMSKKYKRSHLWPIIETFLEKPGECPNSYLAYTRQLLDERNQGNLTVVSVFYFLNFC